MFVAMGMIWGNLHVFEFSVISDKDEFEVQKDLRNIFYQEKSPIEQLHVSKKKGKSYKFKEGRTSRGVVFSGVGRGELVDFVHDFGLLFSG